MYSVALQPVADHKVAVAGPCRPRGKSLHCRCTHSIGKLFTSNDVCTSTLQQHEQPSPTPDAGCTGPLWWQSVHDGDGAGCTGRAALGSVARQCMLAVHGGSSWWQLRLHGAPHGVTARCWRCSATVMTVSSTGLQCMQFGSTASSTECCATECCATECCATECCATECCATECCATECCATARPAGLRLSRCSRKL